ncbi:MAG TPA: phosphopyruvate hydratase [Patescibacteria group bacterium]|nr:phosphopyruvate hydratase [Patescibacteria group bacterium]
MPTIKDIRAREILDSRGNPTVEVDVTFDDGGFGRASVPSGASTGIHEALELRDGDPNRYGGKGVLTAVKNVNDSIRDLLVGQDVGKLRAMDRMMIALDGTINKSKLGANAILGTSMALAKAKASSKKIPLYQFIRTVFNLDVRDVYRDVYTMPVPMMNVLNGGKHADSSVDIQEMMIVPAGFNSFREALRAGSETFYALKDILKKEGLSTGVGDEGGFAPNLKNNEEGLKFLVQAIKNAGYLPGEQIFIALDPAASSFFENGKYIFKDGSIRNSNEMIALYEDWIGKYPIISLEDGLSEDDWEGWVKLTENLKHRVQLVGDDLFVTNTERLRTGIQKCVANSILIKLNQIGSVSETCETINLALENKYTAIVSHRSGETEDSFIADFVVGAGTGQIKTGSLSRSERVSKYNQILRIEEELGDRAIFKGKGVFGSIR